VEVSVESDNSIYPVNNLLPCPCGATPERLFPATVERSKWAQVYGVGNGCCGEWHVEFRTNYSTHEDPEFKLLANDAWNAAPRSNTELDAALLAIQGVRDLLKALDHYSPLDVEREPGTLADDVLQEIRFWYSCKSADVDD